MRTLSLAVVLGAAVVSANVRAAAPASPAPAASPAILGSTAVSWEEIQARPLNGRARQVFKDPTATLDELEMHVTTLPPGQASHPPHKHPDEELIIVKEGTVEALVNGVTKRLGPGSVIFQAANQMHGLRNAGDTPAVYHVIRWNSPGMLKARQP
ncbi:MAG: cupin domain-containing protein [Acidobacteria bacterium]|nr:MAG: cupin domain-containing protein [Acidobacteriota bacterium]